MTDTAEIRTALAGLRDPRAATDAELADALAVITQHLPPEPRRSALEAAARLQPPSP